MNAEEYRARAEECHKRARKIADAAIKQEYEELAFQWLELAHLLRLNESDQRREAAYRNPMF